MIVAGDGAPSVTRFSLVVSGFSRTGTISLLRCRLVTGRMHQIRVHLAARGWPIVGDPIYGPAIATAPSFPRQALHASRVALSHPATGARLEVEAPLPHDLRVLLADCGLRVPER
jgi:23S rRNA pseudouridine1911/1915/1917 synthase